MMQRHRQLAAVMNQEHQSRDVRWAELCVDAKMAGWQVAGAQAKQTAKKGTSGGVAVAVRSHFVIGLCAESADLCLLGSEGTLAAAWTRIGLGTSIFILSAYVWHSEELSMRNKSILLTAMARAMYVGCPWVIGADVQMPT